MKQLLNQIKQKKTVNVNIYGQPKYSRTYNTLDIVNICKETQIDYELYDCAQPSQRQLLQAKIKQLNFESSIQLNLSNTLLVVDSSDQIDTSELLSLFQFNAVFFSIQQQTAHEYIQQPISTIITSNYRSLKPYIESDTHFGHYEKVVMSAAFQSQFIKEQHDLIYFHDQADLQDKGKVREHQKRQYTSIPRIVRNSMFLAERYGLKAQDYLFYQSIVHDGINNTFLKRGNSIVCTFDEDFHKQLINDLNTMIQ